MESTKPSVMTKSNSEGLDRVRKGDGLYAFFMEAAAIEYHVERYCELKQLGGLLDSKGYGIALPKGQFTVLHHCVIYCVQTLPTRRPSRLVCWPCRSAAPSSS
jgi:hypothetical protein